MGLDIRKPIGLLFVILGLTLAVYGLAGDPAQYRKSNGRNINLTWGCVMTAVGGAFLLWSQKGASRSSSQ
jgi:hypothetical protein